MKECSKHKSYKAARKPRSDCLECWKIWSEKHPDNLVCAKDLLRILSRIHKDVKEIEKAVINGTYRW